MNIPTLAVIIPCYNEELCINATAARLLQVLEHLIKANKIRRDSYLYFVDDGSKDRTWEIIEELHKRNRAIKGQKFIKNFGNQKAIIAGLEAVKKSDVIVLFQLMRICSRMSGLLKSL